MLLPRCGSGQETKGKSLSLVDWNHYTKLDEYTSKIAGAYAFQRPKSNKSGAGHLFI